MKINEEVNYKTHKSYKVEKKLSTPRKRSTEYSVLSDKLRKQSVNV